MEWKAEAHGDGHVQVGRKCGQQVIEFKHRVTEIIQNLTK
jgi:hypothetical protein